MEEMTMAAMDEFRKEREAIKHAPFKEKVNYFWDYYKWYVIIGILVIVALTSFIYNTVTKKDVLLNGILLNVYQTESDMDGVVKGFYEFEHIDEKKEEISLNSSLFYQVGSSQSYQALQVLMAWSGAEQLDFITCSDVESMTDLAYRGYFTDLTEALNPVDVEKYKDLFYYMDEDVMIKRSEAITSGQVKEAFPIPDPTKPEEMSSPIPVFMKVSDSDLMRKAYGVEDEDIVLGILPNAPHPNMAVRFLNFIME